MAETEPNPEDPRTTAPPFIPRSNAPHEVYANVLAKQRIQLALTMEQHIGYSMLHMSAGDFGVLDMIVSGSIQRSYHLVEGFIRTWDGWNITAAAPLVRLQIDSLIRLSYLLRHPDAHALAHQLLRVDSFRELRDDHNQRLTDRVLVNSAAGHYPWLPPVYDKANEWVHFSTRHLCNTFFAPDAPENALRIEGRIPLDPTRIPLRFLDELLGAMTEATHCLLDLAEAWAEAKPPPLTDRKSVV